MIQSKWIWPSLIVLSALLAGSLAFTNSTIELRPLFALWFLLVCPGMAFVRLLPIKETAAQWTLAVALSLALDALVAAILVYARLWSPSVALAILIAASLAGASLQLKPESWLAPIKPPEITLPVGDDNLWYRKVIKSLDDRTATLRGLISSITRRFLPLRTKGLTLSNSRILLVDGDGIVAASACNFIKESGYEMQYIQSADEAVNVIAKIAPDLILLDIGKPGLDGWDILHRLRERSSASIIILTTELEEADILHGFHLGANDYITKPVALDKLEARVAAVLSRSRAIIASKDTVTSAELTINFKRRQVMADGQEVNLTPKEYRLLEVLAHHANCTIPPGRLFTEVCGTGHESNEQYIRRLVFSLRKKIESDPGKPKHIITRRGYGYRFE